MKQTIEIDKETAKAIDDARGNLSRDEYIENLLKKHKGVTFPHTLESTTETDLEK
jgi:hypothetical protein